MSQPQIGVQMSFSTDPASAPSWTDITTRVLGFSIRRGRSHEREPFQAGSLTIQLDDPSRDFDPLNTSGAYYPNVRTLRRIRLQATWASVTYDLFHGYVTNYTESYPKGYPTEARCTIQANDAFAILALAKLNTTLAQQTTAARFTSVLDAIGWPSADRSLHAPQQSVLAVTLADMSALTHLQATIDSENGFFFLSKSNVITSFNRHSRVKLPITNYGTFGDGGGAEELYADLSYSTPGDRIVNDARVTATDGTQQVVADATSQGHYYIRSASVSGGPQIRDADAYRVAGFLVGRYGEPLGAYTLDLDPINSVVWTHLLARELNDRITVTKHPAGASISQVCHIDAMSIDFISEVGIWRATWGLTPADTTAYWQVEDATYGVLDSTTRVGY